MLGDNGVGQLGNGTTISSAVPVTGISDAISLSRACVVLRGGPVQCWGDNANGELGNGTTTSSPVPVALVTGISDAVAVDTGVGHSCAVLYSGVTKCWGANSGGELGNGTMTTGELVPVTVSGITNTLASGDPHFRFLCVTRTFVARLHCEHVCLGPKRGPMKA